MKEKEIKRYIAQRLGEEASLTEIQREINEKFNERLTFMDVRVLASELEDVDWGDEEPAAEKVDDNGEEEEIVEPEVTGGTGTTVVEISKLVKPGTALSGTVVFASGSKADWYVDSYGRLGIDNLQGEKPTEEDVRDFQKELQKQLGQ